MLLLFFNIVASLDVCEQKTDYAEVMFGRVTPEKLKRGDIVGFVFQARGSENLTDPYLEIRIGIDSIPIIRYKIDAQKSNDGVYNIKKRNVLPGKLSPMKYTVSFILRDKDRKRVGCVTAPMTVEKIPLPSK